jgi:hypothetical protein
MKLNAISHHILKRCSAIGRYFVSKPITLTAIACTAPLRSSEMENTGRHSQFYEKFTTRHHIAVILRELWSVPDHRQRMLEQSKYGQIMPCCASMFVLAHYWNRASVRPSFTTAQC